jgi:arsenite-transporting ATPase
VEGLESLVDGLSKDGHGLVMMVGKGGVGKTTMAASIALALSMRGFPVHLTTTDPAAHLLRTLPDAPSNLTVSRIDPEVETEKYRQLVLKEKGNGLDREGLLMLEEDLRSPCTEEIAVFQAFSNVIAESDHKFVVVDTAPTGHTLLLLDATGAYHREVSRHIKEGDESTTPMMRLQNPEKTKIIVVSLLETTPVLEALSLEADLLRAGIQTWGWIFNNSLSASGTRSPLLRERALSEALLSNEVRKMIKKPVVVVGMQDSEPIGSVNLQGLSKGNGSVSRT